MKIGSTTARAASPFPSAEGRGERAKRTRDLERSIARNVVEILET
jgi:hypothetical protein